VTLIEDVNVVYVYLWRRYFGVLSSWCVVNEWCAADFVHSHCQPSHYSLHRCKTHFKLSWLFWMFSLANIQLVLTVWRSGNALVCVETRLGCSWAIVINYLLIFHFWWCSKQKYYKNKYRLLVSVMHLPSLPETDCTVHMLFIPHCPRLSNYSSIPHLRASGIIHCLIYPDDRPTFAD